MVVVEVVLFFKQNAARIAIIKLAHYLSESQGERCMEPTELMTEPKTSSQPPEETISAEAAAFQGLAEIFANVKGPGPGRRYVLERIDGELVFRQIEIDAAIEAAIAALPDSGRTASGRRIIKLP